MEKNDRKKVIDKTNEKREQKNYKKILNKK